MCFVRVNQPQTCGQLILTVCWFMHTWNVCSSFLWWRWYCHVCKSYGQHVDHTASRYSQTLVLHSHDCWYVVDLVLKFSNWLHLIILRVHLAVNEAVYLHHLVAMSLVNAVAQLVKSRLTDYLSSNNLLNPHQSAYCTPFHWNCSCLHPRSSH